VDTLSGFKAAFWKIAWEMAGTDSFLAEDLYQDMCLHHLFMRPGESKQFYIVAARNAAIDCLRSKKVNYREKQNTMSLEAMESAGCQVDTEGNIYRPTLAAMQAADGVGGAWEDDE